MNEDEMEDSNPPEAIDSEPDWRHEFPEIPPFPDSRMNEIAIRMRMIMMDPVFRPYREGNWEEFQEKFLTVPKRFEMDTGKIIWAAFTLSAVQGDLSLAAQWIADHLHLGWLTFGPDPMEYERRLISFGFSERMQIYQAADEVYNATLEWEQANPTPKGEEKLLNWPLLKSQLSQQEIFWIQQALSFDQAAASTGRATPKSLQGAIDLLMNQLAAGTVKDEVIVILSWYLGSALTEDEEIIYASSLGEWPEALHWLRTNKKSGSRLVQDVLELRKFFPDIR